MSELQCSADDCTECSADDCTEPATEAMRLARPAGPLPDDLLGDTILPEPW